MECFLWEVNVEVSLVEIISKNPSWRIVMRMNENCKENLEQHVKIDFSMKQC